MGEKELTPAIRFKGFTDPWEQRKLGNIASLYQPHTISSDDLLPAGIPVFGANGYIGFYSEANHWVDQVTISARGEEAGTPNYVVSPAWITGNSMVVNTDSVEIDKKFLYFNLCATPLKKFVTGGAQPQLTRSVLGKAEIAVTVIVEERAISSILGCLSSLIALHQRKLEKLQRMKQALLEKLFPKNGAVVPELRFNGFTDAWEQRKLEQISTRVTSIGHDLSLPRIEYEDIVARRGELKKEIAKNISLKIGILFAPGDVLYGKLRPYLMHWLHPQFSGVAVGDFWVFRPTSTDSSFFYCLIQSEQFQQAAAVSIGSKMPRADWKYVSEFPYLVPKQIHEQQNIGLLFEGLELYIALHQRKLEKLQQLKSAFLTKMFV